MISREMLLAFAMADPAAPTKAAEHYEFGAFRLDATTRALYRRGDSWRSRPRPPTSSFSS
jgi:hypothetical protein